MLHTALGYEPPAYAHAPLLLGGDGRRLAKRHGNLGLSKLRTGGTEPEAVIGWLAHISGLIDRYEEVSARDLISSFSLDQVSKTPFQLDRSSLAALVILNPKTNNKEPGNIFRVHLIITVHMN